MGGVDCYFEPETLSELQNLCKKLYEQRIDFDIIGHTSNIYYVPGYHAKNIVSTRSLTQFLFTNEDIYCECGVPVRKLSLEAIKHGIAGFEGLIDLPGTVAAAVYGNAGCYGCSISSLLMEATIIDANGKVLHVGPEWFGFEKRSSLLKRAEKNGIILSVRLKRLNCNKQKLEQLAEENHKLRIATQPKPHNTLGSIFREDGSPTLCNMIIMIVVKVFVLFYYLVGKSSSQIKEKKKHLVFKLLNATDIEPYVHHWNCYYWKDKSSHYLFWKYVRIHRLMFKKNDFEIEIKKNSSL